MGHSSVRFLDPIPALLASLDFRRAESGSGCEARRLSNSPDYQRLTCTLRSTTRTRNPEIGRRHPRYVELKAQGQRRGMREVGFNSIQASKEGLRFARHTSIPVFGCAQIPTMADGLANEAIHLCERSRREILVLRGFPSRLRGGRLPLANLVDREGFADSAQRHLPGARTVADLADETRHLGVLDDRLGRQNGGRIG